MEKLDINFLLNYIERPDYLQPGAKMPGIRLSTEEKDKLRQFIIDLRQRIETGEVKPIYNYYRMEKVEKLE